MMKKLTNAEIKMRLNSADAEWHGDSNGYNTNFIRCQYDPEHHEIYAVPVCITEYGSIFGNDEYAILRLQDGEAVRWPKDNMDIEWGSN
jgi:hypothetical protein